jgi:hypothetical protein
MPGAEAPGIVKRKGILFGDDNWGTVLDEEAPHKNNRGIEMKRYRIIPGEHLVKQYARLQQPDVLDKYGSIWVEYPTYYVEDSNPSRTNAIVRIDCGFDGRETALTKRHAKLQKEIALLREELENVQISNMTLEEENRQLMAETKLRVKEINEINQLIKGGTSGVEERNPYEREES